MNDVVIAAFLASRSGRSPDFVIADPETNRQFLEACRAFRLVVDDATLNRCLYSLRKSGALSGIRSKRTRVPHQQEFKFAAEIAIRFLERRDQTTLDEILCDPARRTEFDNIAADIAPGHSVFEYRWAALGLRKTRKFRPEILARVVPALEVVSKRAVDIRVEDLPNQPGLYLFLDREKLLYVGECQSLRKRVGKHLGHSDNKGLARWLWQHGVSDLHVEYHVLSKQTSTRERKALEVELIRSRLPQFNISGMEP